MDPAHSAGQTAYIACCARIVPTTLLCVLARSYIQLSIPLNSNSVDQNACDQETSPQDCCNAAREEDHISQSHHSIATALAGENIDSRHQQTRQAIIEADRLFQKVLDNSLTCLRIKAVDEEYLPCLKRLLQRSHNVPTLKAVTVSGRGVNKGVLFRSIPKGITTLRMRGSDNNLKHVKRMSCLMFLYLDTYANDITGIEHISGLTYLRCDTLDDSVAHLAPTLKHLHVWEIDSVLELNKLSNLETLEVWSDMPTNLFETHTQLPLKHLSLFQSMCEDFIKSAKTWSAAPSTLTRLRLSSADHLQPCVIPATITHLQLVYAEQDCIGKVAAALPWLSNLDLFMCLEEGDFDWKTAFCPVSKLNKLQCLGLWVTRLDVNINHVSWPRQQVVSALTAVPAVAAAMKRDLKLNIVETGGGLLGAEDDGVPAKATWAVSG